MKKGIFILFFVTLSIKGYNQPFLFEQPLFSQIQGYEEQNHGVLTQIENPDYLDDFRYPYKNIYIVGAPVVYLKKLDKLYLYHQYYKVENEDIIRFTKYVWSPVKPNANVLQKNKALQNDQFPYKEYVSLFDSIYKSISKQLGKEPTELIGVDTIYKDGKIYYSYKSASWYSENREINLFYHNSTTWRNITLYTHWFSNEDKEELRTQKYGKVYPTVELTKVPTFNHKGMNIQSYIKKHFKPKTKITKKNATRVFAILTLSQEGQVVDVNIIRGTDEKLTQELKYFLAIMPYWNPGEYKGKRVACELNVPVDLTSF